MRERERERERERLAQIVIEKDIERDSWKVR